MSTMKKIIFILAVLILIILAFVAHSNGHEKRESATPSGHVVTAPAAEPIKEIRYEAMVIETPTTKEVVTKRNAVAAPVVVDPYWLTYIKEQSTKGAFYLSAYNCIIEWESNLAPSKAFAMHNVAQFMNSSESEKNASVYDIFAYTYQNQPCTLPDHTSTVTN